MAKRKTTKTPKAKTPRAKQIHVPGTAPKVHQDILDAAEVWEDARDTKVAAKTEYNAATEALCKAMADHNMTVYEIDDVIITTRESSTKKSAKVQRVKPKNGSDPHNDDWDEDEEAAE